MLMKKSEIELGVKDFSEADFISVFNCVPVGRRRKTAAFDAVFGVVPTPRSGRRP